MMDRRTITFCNPRWVPAYLFLVCIASVSPALAGSERPREKSSAWATEAIAFGVIQSTNGDDVHGPGSGFCCSA